MEEISDAVTKVNATPIQTESRGPRAWPEPNQKDGFPRQQAITAGN